MAGKLMNVCGEISEKNWIDGDKFKQIVDGTEIKAQHKYGQEFDFKPRCAQWFAGNHIPKTKDTSGGFNRRWLFLEFNKVVSDEEKVVDIEKVILAAEREQIAAWAVQAIERMRRTGQYTFPISHEILVNQMSAENNSVHYFLADCPRLRIGRAAHEGRSETRTSETRLHHEYSLFCISMGLARPVMPRRFHAMMKDLERVFGFKQLIKMTDRNGMLAEYEWLTLADAKPA
jgi:phage/plasmid-associated DNA primase